MDQNDGHRRNQTIAPESVKGGLTRKLVAMVALVFRHTPRPLRPCLWVILFILQITIVTILTLLVANLIHGDTYELDFDFITWVTACGLSSALAFGIAREYLPLPKRGRRWVLAFIASCFFWLTLDLLAFFRHGKSVFDSTEGLLVIVGAILVCGATGALLMKKRAFNDDEPA
jgi:hypothetical protein